MGKKSSASKGNARGEVVDPNVLNKSFDKILAEASEEVNKAAKEAKKAAPGAAASSSAAVDVDESPISSPASLVFAAMAVGPCAALYSSPKFGITLADKGVILIAVAVLAVALLSQAYAANVKSARISNSSSAGRKKSTTELHFHAIFFVNLAFLLLFLFVGFVVLPTLGDLVPVEITYGLTVAGNAIFVYLWQTGAILKGIA
jgi:hypothetical protein